MYKLTITQTIVDIILAIGEGLQNFFAWIIGFLPNDPFQLDVVLDIPPVVQDALSFVNWLVPLADILTMVTLWITLILAVWFVRALLKLAHVI